MLLLRFADFMVNEIDTHGKVVRLESLEAKPEKEEVDWRKDLSLDKLPSFDSLNVDDRKLVGAVSNKKFKIFSY